MRSTKDFATKRPIPPLKRMKVLLTILVQGLLGAAIAIAEHKPRKRQWIPSSK